MTDFTALEARITGPVFVPGDDGYAEEVAGFNLHYEHRPEVAVGVASLDDAIAAVEFARLSRMPVSVLATGHGSHAPVTGGMLVNTTRLDHLHVDPAARLATVGAGVRWGAVVAAAAEHGLAPVTGSSSNVGAIGYLLGGGLGPLARSHGFSSDWVRGYEIVTPDHGVLRASVDENPELFWALRGGKGGFGLVTSATLELARIPSLYAGSLVFDEEHIEQVLKAWIAYTTDADERVTTSVAVFHFPPATQVPENLRGKTLLMLRFAFPGDAEEGEALLAPLRASAPPIIDGVHPLPLADIATIHNDPDDPGYGFSRGRLLGPIDEGFADVLLGFVGAGTQTPVMVCEVRHLGGATRHDVEEGSAAGGRASAYTLSLIGAPNPDLFAEALPAATGAIIDALTPWVSPETNINFAGDTNGEQAALAWSPDVAARLAAVRAQYDSEGAFGFAR